ncbi:MAG: PmoA family protein [Verrucomicrobiales bacterium]
MLFLLSPAQPAQGEDLFSWRETGASLALLQGDQILWQFNHLGDGIEKGVPYFHPLATMDGAVLTDLHPDDHLWHRGLRFAWKIINGVEGYWVWPEGKARWPEKELGHTDVTGVEVFPGKDFSARFELELSYHPPGKPPALTEKRTIVVGAPDENGDYQIDWRGVFTAVGGDTLLDRTPIPGEEGGKAWGGYAGLQFRVSGRDNLAAWTILNSEGIRIANKIDAQREEQKKSLERAHGKPARWLDLTLDLADGKTGGVTILDHPDNLRHPAPWHVSSMPHELICTPLYRGPYSLEEGKTLTFQFRIVVHPGGVGPDRVEKQWEEFSQSAAPAAG